MHTLEHMKTDIKYLIQINLQKDEESVGDYEFTSLSKLEDLSDFNHKLEDQDFFRITVSFIYQFKKN